MEECYRLADGWQAAPPAPNEVSRIAKLRHYEILDSGSEDAFDRITRLAAAALGTPMALISLIDENRQWFKSHHGLDATQTPRDMAFCSHVILQNEVMVVPDTTKDPRFFGNPLVTSAPDIRFYAGAPLTTSDGFSLGTICIIDKAPRTLSEKETGILRDLASMVIDEIELRYAGRKSLQATQAKSKFIANISHEIRTPLNVIMGFADMLQESSLSLEQRQQISTIRASSEVLLDIVNDVMDISKIEAGKLELENLPFSIRHVVDDVCSLFSLKAAEKYLPLLTEFVAPIPERVIGDPYRMRQILLNLVSNAIKFTNSGHVKIIVSYHASKQRLTCCVEDTGIGIKKENLKRIFEDFSQEDMSVTRKYGGTGLGLSICSRLMELMGGKIEFESTAGRGSKFFFHLRLPVAPESDIQAIAQKLEVRAALCAHVLVVEDIELNQRVARHALEKMGCTVDMASNAKEAIAFAMGQYYDAIFMDLHMPDMDGLEITRYLRAQELLSAAAPRIIIAMTASALLEDRRISAESGMNDFLSKPLKPDAVYAILQKYINNK